MPASNDQRALGLARRVAPCPTCGGYGRVYPNIRSTYEFKACVLCDGAGSRPVNIEAIRAALAAEQAEERERCLRLLSDVPCYPEMAEYAERVRAGGS